MISQDQLRLCYQWQSCMFQPSLPATFPRQVLTCTVLYCTAQTVLYCTVLYCTVLYCTVLYCTVLYCTVLYCTVPGPGGGHGGRHAGEEGAPGLLPHQRRCRGAGVSKEAHKEILIRRARLLPLRGGGGTVRGAAGREAAGRAGRGQGVICNNVIIIKIIIIATSCPYYNVKLS